MDKRRMHMLRDRMEKELRDNILRFWIQHAPSGSDGGFHGAIRVPCDPVPDAPRSLVLNARILWTYSASYRGLGDPQYLEMANRAFLNLMNHFLDREHGGMFWMLDRKNTVVDAKKQTYGNAFAIYALAEYHRATGIPEAREAAIELYRIVECHTHDPVHGGYLEACTRNWLPLEDMTLSSKECNAPKTMNTHLHMLEAYTNLYRIWPDSCLVERIREMLRIFSDHIVADGEDRFLLYFDMEWHSLSRTVSFGHDIEGSWLLDEAAEVLADPTLEAQIGDLSVRMARRALLHGLDPVHGGMYDELSDHVLHDGKVWWVQAEAVVGFMNAWRHTGDEVFLEAMLDTWMFTDAHLIDHAFGEWFGATDASGRHGYAQSTERQQKAGPWKCPYHNARMCLEMLHRLDRAMGA